MSSDSGSGSPSSYPKSSSDGEDTERHERMRDWLLRQINSNRFPGLEWLDPEKTIFKVPWIHAKKRGYNRERDAAIFKEWAIHSGKYRDESDPTVWKINFRCAINGLKDIVELKDYQTEDCRVYKVLPRTRPLKRRSRRPSVRSTTEPYSYPVVTAAASTLLGATRIPSAAWPSSCTYPSSLSSEPYPINSTTCSYQPNMCLPGPYPSMTVPTVSMNNTNVSEVGSSGYYYNPSPIPYSQSFPSSCSMSCSNLDTCMPRSVESTSSTSLAIRREESPSTDSGYGGVVETNSIEGSPLQMCPSPEMQSYNSPAAIPSVSSCSVVNQSSIRPSCSVISDNTTTVPTTENIINVIEDLEDKSPNPISPPPPPPNQLNIAVYYNSVLITNRTVSCKKGCRFYCGPNTTPATNEQAATFESLFGPLEAEQIALPTTHPLPEAQEIFDTMKRGLLIEMHDNDIYATPLCCNVVFCGTSYYHQSQPLERERRTKVFNYNEHFQPALEQYSLHRGPQPDPHVIFSLGQPWGPTQPITQNCVFIVVTHTQAKHDLEVYGPPFPFTHLFSSIPDMVDIRQDSVSDLRAEAFLNTVFPC